MHGHRWNAALGAALTFLCCSNAVSAQDEVSQAGVRLDAEQMLQLSEQAAAQGQEATARRILEVLVEDPRLRIRSEARFRLAMLALGGGERRRAALLLRAILDEEPDAQRVRLELARVLALMGDLEGARRALRQAQAGGLPAEVALIVDRYSAALWDQRPLGGHLEVALAPDSNINRATRSDTLDTVIGEFELTDDAQARSGIGLSLRGSGYFRRPLGGRTRLLAQAGYDASLYRADAFNDIAAQVSLGPEFQFTKGRLQLLMSHQRRWFGGEPFTRTGSAKVEWERPLSPTSQLRLSGEVSRTKVIPNPLQDATALLGKAYLEKALSQRDGVSLGVSGGRQIARDAGYSTFFGEAEIFGWREHDRMTFVAGASYARLAADERIALYPRRRKESLVRVTAGATLRQLTVAGFAPQLRFTWERNASTLEIYDYSRLRSEIGIVRAF